ncbi:MAG: glycosyl transferase [Devosia sp.]|nr:glycosyl transferase [Devosia sp.]
MAASQSPPRVLVLLATYNGAAYLDEQLASIAAQNIAGVDLVASDDGSTDGTLDLLTRWQAQWSKGSFAIRPGPQQGVAANFRSLILCDAALAAEFAAFSDQDDIWLPDHLSRGVAVHRAGDGTRPGLYCERTEIIAEDGTPRDFSPLFRRQPDFRNALIQSIAGGNTMVFNRTALDLLQEAARRARFSYHDWWAYMMITGGGGWVHYETEPHVRYRQHGGNLIGENNSWRARFFRFGALLRGQFTEWNRDNLVALTASADQLTPEARVTIAEFETARTAGLLRRLAALARSGVYRQTAMSQVLLFVACAIRRI